MLAVSVLPPLETREGQIFLALRDAYPDAVSAQQLMNLVGLSWQFDPVRSFTLLAISFSKLRQELVGSGWKTERTDGTPDGHYWLSRTGGGHS